MAFVLIVGNFRATAFPGGIGTAYHRNGYRPPKNRPGAGGEFPGTERLGDIVVGADLEAHHSVDFIGARGQEDDRYRGITTNLPAKLKTVGVGQTDIENNERKGGLFQCGLSVPSGRYPFRLKAVGGKSVHNIVRDT